MTMYQCLNRTADVLEQELYEDKTRRSLTYEEQSEEGRLNYLFDRIWYRDLCNKIKELAPEKIQEFMSNAPKWSDQIKQLLTTISFVVKERDVKVTNVSGPRSPRRRPFCFFACSTSVACCRPSQSSIQPMRTVLRTTPGRMSNSVCRVRASPSPSSGSLVTVV